MLEKNSEYFKERDKNINQNKIDMVKAITNLTQVTNMVFLQITNNNHHIKVLIQVPKTKDDEIGNDATINN
jgi:Mg/Co/Ni transporter MgtE